MSSASSRSASRATSPARSQQASPVSATRRSTSGAGAARRSPRRTKTEAEKLAEVRKYIIDKDKVVAQEKFDSHIQALIDHLNTINTLSNKVYSGGKKSGGQLFKLPNGAVVTKADVRNLQTEYKEKLAELAQYRKFANKRWPEPKSQQDTTNQAQQAIKLLLINDNGIVGSSEISLFFDDAFAAGRMPEGLREQWNILKLGAARGFPVNTKILNDLFLAYVRENGLIDPKDGRNFTLLPVAGQWPGDELFTEHFSVVVDEIMDDQVAKEAEKRRKDPNWKPKLDKQGNPTPKTSPETFRFTSFQQVISKESTTLKAARENPLFATYVAAYGADKSPQEMAVKAELDTIGTNIRKITDKMEKPARKPSVKKTTTKKAPKQKRLL